jgi:hypothetical protein
MLRDNSLIPAPVDQLYCIRNAEVKEYHVLAASWSGHDHSDDRLISDSFLSQFSMLFRVLYPLLAVVEDAPEAEIDDLVDHNIEIGRLVGF